MIWNELTRTFMMISNLKNTFGLHVLYKNISLRKGWCDTYIDVDNFTVKSIPDGTHFFRVINLHFGHLRFVNKT